MTNTIHYSHLNQVVHYLQHYCFLSGNEPVYKENVFITPADMYNERISLIYIFIFCLLEISIFFYRSSSSSSTYVFVFILKFIKTFHFMHYRNIFTGNTLFNFSNHMFKGKIE